MVWKLVGEPSFESSEGAVEVGPVVVPTEGGLSVKLSVADPDAIPYGYALLSFVSSYGEEMGRILVWPRVVPTVYRLGDGMRVRDPFGVLVFEPKNFSRRWVTAADQLSVRILADLPDPALADSHIPPGFADSSGRELTFIPSGGAGRITYPV